MNVLKLRLDRQFDDHHHALKAGRAGSRRINDPADNIEGSVVAMGDEGRLAVEVMIERALGGAELCRDVVEGHAIDPAAVEEVRAGASKGLEPLVAFGVRRRGQYSRQASPRRRDIDAINGDPLEDDLGCHGRHPGPERVIRVRGPNARQSGPGQHSKQRLTDDVEIAGANRTLLHPLGQQGPHCGDGLAPRGAHGSLLLRIEEAQFGENGDGRMTCVEHELHERDDPIEAVARRLLGAQQVGLQRFASAQVTLVDKILPIQAVVIEAGASDPDAASDFDQAGARDAFPVELHRGLIEHSGVTCGARFVRQRPHRSFSCVTNVNPPANRRL